MAQLGIITAVGKAHIADQLAASPAQAPMTYMAIGTGTPSATALGSELMRVGIQQRTDSGATVTYVAHWDIDDNISGTITEAGIFNAGSGLGGTMLSSAVISPADVKGINDTLTITWTLTVQ